MITFRDYQEDIINRGSAILRDAGFVYLAMEVRTGKTLTSLGMAEKVGAKEVLFLTKKKAISSIEGDYKLLNPSFNCYVINYESLHKIPSTPWDLIVCDEAHGMGAFPKPSKRAKQVKALLQETQAKVILLSGTPTPESFSQMYHQVYGIPNNPFRKYKNFYRFADDHVKFRQMKINGFNIKDYKGGLDSIIDEMKPYTISQSQVESGFSSSIDEHTLYVDMKPSTYALAKRLEEDLVVEGNEEVLLADTAVKLMMKLHQIYSGTVKFESGKSMTLDSTKAEFIKEHFKGQKIGIFYKFTQELKTLQEVFGDDLVTTLDEFNGSDKHIALQIVSGREGISLREADSLVYYNIDFSATSYWQSRDRMTTKERAHNKVYWVFSRGGLEDKIYKAVSKKKDYTVKYFKKRYND
tara:strand:+ start:3586 stop:4815 length:1230 start_codon:yes stop_codon:yes gene_type:complete